MSPKRNNFLVLSAVGLSILTCFVLFNSDYFPNTSLAVFFIYLATLVYYVKQEKTRLHTYEYLLIVVLALFLIIRANHIVIVLNLIGIIFLGALLSLTSAKEEHLSSLIVSPMLVILQTLKEHNIFKLKLSYLDKPTRKSKQQVIETLIVVLVSLLTFAVVGALLGSANPQFGKLFETLIEAFNLKGLFTYISGNVRVDRLIASIVFSGLLLKYLSLVYSNKTLLTLPTALQHKIDLRLPLLIACTLISVFSLFQLDAHFSTTTNLSKQTNDVFAQLSAVCLVVFVLLLNNKTRDKTYNVIKSILYLQLVYLLLVALRSDLYYMSQWGLTHKRLYGLVVIAWIVGIYVSYIKYIDRGTSMKKFYEASIVFTSILLVSINIINFDKLIYTYKPSTHARPIDHAYLARLSADSSYHYEHFQELKSIENNSPALDTEWNFIMHLQTKYDKPNFQSFNLSEYLQYKKIKNIYVDLRRTTPVPIKAD